MDQESDQRSRHHCSIIGKNTMLVVGGIAPLNDFPLPTWTTQGCDTKPMFAQGLGMFSLNNHSWTTEYDPVAAARPYQIHPSISNVIGGNANGGSTTQEPISGFDTKSLGTLLVPKSSNNATNSTSMTEHPGTKPRLSNGVIAGIVGGCVTGFVLSIAIGFIIFLRRRQRSWTPTLSEMNGQVFRSELNGFKTPTNSEKKFAAVELSDDEKSNKDLFVERAELGDVKEWVYELSASPQTNKSLPPTPGIEKPKSLWD